MRKTAKWDGFNGLVLFINIVNKVIFVVLLLTLNLIRFGALVNRETFYKL